MSGLELALRIAAWFASAYSLALAAWALAGRWLPATLRPGLRLLATLAGHAVLTAILVQALGLAGLLRPDIYLAASLLPGLLAGWLLRGRRPHHAFGRLLRQAFRLWVVAPGPLLGPATLLGLLYLGGRFFALPADIDALANHASQVASWVQSGRIGLGDSRWNYPLCWEYQFAPSYLLLRSDVLTCLPALLAAVALLLVLRELARTLGIGGRLAHLASLLALSSPVLWREALKGDPIFGVAQLIGILAVARAARNAPGAYWLLQLSLFLIFGTKASGFFYGALLVAAYCWARWRSGVRRSAGEVAGRLGLALLVQASAAAVQVRNLLTYGNPMFPLQWRLGPFLLLDGPSDPSGTAILDHAGEAATWRAFASGAGVAAGLEWPLLILLFALATAKAAGVAGRWIAGRRRGPRPALPALLRAGVAGAAWLLWLAFAATPWVLGLAPGATNFLTNGQSLRFAIAPLGLTYLLAAGMAGRRWVAESRRAALAATLAAFFLIGWKWRGVGLGAEGAAWLWPLAAAWLLLAFAAPAGRWWEKRRGRRRPAGNARLALVAAGLAAAIGLATFYGRQVEAYREASWTPAYKPVWRAILQLPEGTPIALNDSRSLFRYLLYGPRFANPLVLVELGRFGDRGEIPAGIDYLYFFISNRPADLAPAIANLEQRGWRVLARPTDGRGVLLTRNRSG